LANTLIPELATTLRAEMGLNKTDELILDDSDCSWMAIPDM